MVLIISAVILTLFNIIMWIIFATKFYKVFSTDEIIKKTRDQLNSMLSSINRNTERNITLIEDRISELRAVTADAERRLAVLRGELDKTQKSYVLQNQLDSVLTDSNKKSSTDAELKKEPKTLTASTPLDKYRKERIMGGGNDVNKTVSQEYVRGSEIPQICESSHQFMPKKDFNAMVKELALQGKTVEEIASELNRSTQEVKFTLEIL